MRLDNRLCLMPHKSETLKRIVALRKPVVVANKTAVVAPFLVPQPESDGRRNLATALRVQRYLGVSRSTLMRYIADRKIDAIKMDGGWRFCWEDVERFVQRRTQKAA